VRRHGKSRAFVENQSSKRGTSFELLIFDFEFRNFANHEIHEAHKKEMKKILSSEEREGGEGNFALQIASHYRNPNNDV
jgi:hypothetical protein